MVQSGRHSKVKQKGTTDWSIGFAPSQASIILARPPMANLLPVVALQSWHQRSGTCHATPQAGSHWQYCIFCLTCTNNCMIIYEGWTGIARGIIIRQNLKLYGSISVHDAMMTESKVVVSRRPEIKLTRNTLSLCFYSYCLSLAGYALICIFRDRKVAAMLCNDSQIPFEKVVVLVTST